MKFEGVAYDIDGILLDTEEFQYLGWVVPLKLFDITISEEDYIRNYAGKTGSIVEAELIERFKLPVEKGTLLHQKEKLLIEWFSTKDIKLMPYVVEVVTHLKNLGMKDAVCSGGPKTEIMLKLK